jgi:hypothetical protein
MALSKFRHLHRAQGDHLIATDVDPNTPSFSFYGSTYKSPYIGFVGVEMETNAYSISLDTYPTLQTSTSEQGALTAKWDAPTYTTNAGAIPLVYMGDKYLLTGPSTPPRPLQ